MQEFLVKYLHKYAQSSPKICKNASKYALNMQNNYYINVVILYKLILFVSFKSFN